MLRKKKGCTKGFTLVELVIVIAVIAILAAVLIPTFATIINKANESADVQLARNLNSAIADGLYVENELETAQNIRNHVKDFGYEPENIATKNKNNVIVFNKEKRKIEVLNVKDYAGEINEGAYYADEILDGYIIVSTRGNELAEALYDLYNLPSSEPASIRLMSLPVGVNTDPAESIGNHVQGVLDRIDNDDIRSAVESVVTSTIYVTNDGMFIIDLESDEIAYKIYSIPVFGNTEDLNLEGYRPRVAFNSNVENFKIEDYYIAGSGLKIVVPNDVAMGGEKQTKYGEDYPEFAGNVNTSLIPKSNIKSIKDIKQDVEELTPEQVLLSTRDQVYTSDFKGNFSKTLSRALEMYDAKVAAEEENPEVRLVVNGNVTISGNVTIPQWLTVEIPFAIGNSEAADIMTNENNNALLGRPLGAAYPANDAENINEQLFYLCGEGPGGGPHATLGNNSDYDEDILAIFEASKNVAGADKKADYSLTITGTLNIEGLVRIGGVVGYTDATGYQGHTSGAYAEIINNGTINVNGGVLDVWGFIKGSGKVVANESGMVYEPFVVADYLDTFPTALLYPFLLPDGWDNKVYNSPFMRFSVMNIQTTCTINYGAALYGRANLIVFSKMYCRADAPLVTSDGYYLDPEDGTYKVLDVDNLPDGYEWHEDSRTLVKTDEWGDETFIPVDGAFILSENAQLVSTYSNKGVKIENKNGELNCEDYEYYDADLSMYVDYNVESTTNIDSLAGDIGVLNLTIKGNITTGGIKMDLISAMFPGIAEVVDTSKCTLPISYNYNISVASGAHLTLGKGNKYALMPGAEFTVEQGGILIIEDGAALYAMDAMDNSEFFQSIAAVLGDGSVPDDGLLHGGAFTFSGISLPIDLARKYYPSAKLLKANGFEASAKLTVNGTLKVLNGATVGGIVNATEKEAEIQIKEGAILGEFVTLGGPIDTVMLSFVLGNDISQLVMTFLTMTIHPCFLRIVGPDGELFDYSDCYQSNFVDDVEALVNAFFGDMADSITIDESVHNAFQDESIEVYRVATKDSTIKLTSTSETVYELEEANVAYVLPNLELMQIILKARQVKVGTKHYGGSWTIA